jgi:hypothetical protein
MFTSSGMELHEVGEKVLWARAQIARVPEAARSTTGLRASFLPQRARLGRMRRSASRALAFPDAAWTGLLHERRLLAHPCRLWQLSGRTLPVPSRTREPVLRVEGGRRRKNRDRRIRADSAPSRVASGRAGVRTKAVIPASAKWASPERSFGARTCAARRDAKRDLQVSA